MKKNKTKTPNELGDYAGLASDDDKSSSSMERLIYESDDPSSEEEVLPVYSESDPGSDGEDEDTNISESDINDDENDLPDSKAWGKNKKSYYNADNINDQRNILNEEDEEAAKMEEEEAKAIQERLIAKIDDADIAFDLLTDVMVEKEKTDSEAMFNQSEKIEVDLSQINEQEKMELLMKESPELLTYIEDYKLLMLSVRNELLPVIKILKDNKLDQSGASHFIKLYSQLIMNYCTNIIFYVVLKLRKTHIQSHPCSKWLNQYKSMVDETKPTYDNIFKPQIKLIIKGNFKSLSSLSRKRKLNDETNSTVKRVQASVLNEIDCLTKDNQENHIDTMEENAIGENDEAESKRPITYQIAKNKGLTPHRKKELRNPRVKHRIKYRKAKIRRKGQVREVRKEIRKYGGEISGIKATVVKSIKFKT